MFLTCSREALLNSINIVSKAVSNRTTLPILECILLKCEQDAFNLTANDLELGIETAPIECDITEEGSIAIEAKLFSEIIRRVNGDTVKISTTDNKEAKISCGNSEFTIAVNNPEEFPPIPSVSKENSYKIKQKDIKDMINGTIFSITADESKPVLTGELMEIKDGIINVVGVDGYRISFRKCEISASSDAKVVVPGKTLREITKILSSEEDDEAVIYVTDKHILFDLNGNIIVSRLIDGEYIKYEQTFTDDFKTRITVNCHDMISSLERACLISRDARKIPVKLEIQKDKVIITSRTDIGNVYEEVFCETEGEDLKIAFNPRYLIDAFKACDDENVSVSFNSSLSPCIIKPEDNDKYKYLILPLRM